MFEWVAELVGAIVGWVQGTTITVGQAIGFGLIIFIAVLVVIAFVKDEPMWRVEYDDGREVEYRARSGKREVK